MSETSVDAGPRTVRHDFVLWGGAYLLGLAVLSLERLMLFLAEDGVPAGVFWHGLRFDAAGFAYLLAPALLVATLAAPTRFAERVEGLAIGAALALAAVVALVDVHFFGEYRTRLDFVVFEYLDGPGVMIGMSLEHVGWLTAIGQVAAAVLLVVVVVRLVRAARADTRAPHGRALSARLVLLALLVVAARGGLGRPIRPQDADAYADRIANQVTLSAPFTLARHAYEAWRDGGETDYALPAEVDSVELARSVFAHLHDVPQHDSGPSHRRAAHGAATSKNVVVVVLESNVARHVGALGAHPSWTPRFDALAARGTLYTRFLANGPSTNRGLPALLAGWPSVLKRTALTKSREGQHMPLPLGQLMTDAGMQTAFVTAGRSNWENLGGWCRANGFETIVDHAAFDADDAPVWGVDDGVLLDRTLVECDRLAANGAFGLVVLTSSNHPPYTIPENVYAEIDDPIERAFRFADDAVGTFMDDALSRPWARDTLFVLVGDHGVHDLARADIDPERYHVPFLMIDPSREIARRDAIASQVDVLPTIVGHLGFETPIAAWGRDLRAPGAHNHVAIVGPHGGHRAIGLLRADGTWVVDLLDGDGHAYHWDAPADSLTPIADPPDLADLRVLGRAYLHAAHSTLLNRSGRSANAR